MIPFSSITWAKKPSRIFKAPFSGLQDPSSPKVYAVSLVMSLSTDASSTLLRALLIPV
eukprot:CAMPEP_0204891878 /NCGR_PEP_ID=MMETSP1349-20130617/28304_1 /ASSEMBLY_ACC=CAM_ASM_000710 /TAXON_ID=215587 /ORGANISM="Aplanochytrium stocchinoi, Strain GSBS06" /LENGTH=57 /DNA_ID=CAMNT_0052057533 /DNA_START=106 /DNA_END=279 /DNA_ORIENTATION=-